MHKDLNDEFHFIQAGMRLKNRVVLAPLTHNMSAKNGDPSQAELDWLARCIRGRFGLIIAATTQVWSGGRYPLGVTELKDSDSSELIEAFTRAARRAYKAGLHGVELHAAHNFLLCNFLNPKLNRLTDQWGGSVQNGARFLIEIVRGSRARMPRQFLIGVSPETYANVVGIELENQLAVTHLLYDRCA